MGTSKEYNSFPNSHFEFKEEKESKKRDGFYVGLFKVARMGKQGWCGCLRQAEENRRPEEK